MGRRSSKQVNNLLQLLNKAIPFLLLIPFLVLFYNTIFLSAFMMIKQSLGFINISDISNITFEYYLQVFSDPLFMKALRYTFYISIVSSFLCVFTATILVFLVYFSKDLSNKNSFLFRLPIFIPHCVYALLFIQFLSQTGVISRFLVSFGVMSSFDFFPLLVNDKAGFSVIFLYIVKQVPFVFMLITLMINKIDKKIIYTSFALGATKTTTIRKILLPLISPVIISLFLLCFAFAFAGFEIPMLLGNTANETISLRAYEFFTKPLSESKNYAMVLNSILTIISFTSLFLYSYGMKKVKF